MTPRACVLIALICVPIVTRPAQAGIITQPPLCGNGILDPGEECDPPATTCAAPCRADCTCEFSNCCQCGSQCSQVSFCPVECELVAGGLCRPSGACAAPCPCGDTCTTLSGAVGSCRPERGASECFCQATLPESLAALARELESVPVEDDLTADDTPPPSRGDDDRPAVGLRLAIAELERLRTAAHSKPRFALRRAAAAVERAWRHYAQGSPDLSHLGDTVAALRQAQASLDAAALLSPRAGRDEIERIQARLAALARRMAADILRVAGRAGAARGRVAVAQRLFRLGDLAAERNPLIAVTLFGSALNLASNTITFDVALFAQNIAAALAGQTVGHAFSIAYLGQLHQGGESAGLARTAADPPSTAQAPAKEMHVAGVSKTLTAIVIQRLLAEKGLTPEAFIAPYLPGDWTLGSGVQHLRFRHFLTHTSGFGQINAGNDYAAVLTNLRNTTNLLSAAARTAMQEGFLGFMDPANYGFIDGAFGVYYMHGGDWLHSGREAHACAIAFPIQVEAGLVINSARGPIPYQCDLLESAFDNAWVRT